MFAFMSQALLCQVGTNEQWHIVNLSSERYMLNEMGCAYASGKALVYLTAHIPSNAAACKKALPFITRLPNIHIYSRGHGKLASSRFHSVCSGWNERLNCVTGSGSIHYNILRRTEQAQVSGLVCYCQYAIVSHLWHLTMCQVTK